MYKIVLNIYRWMFARPQFQKLNLALFHMSLSGIGILNYKNNKMSGERNFIRKILPKVITDKEPVFFDVGANIGKYSKSLLSAFPNATIHAFEPHPKNFIALKANSQYKCYNVAVGETHGELTLYDRADYDGSSHASLHKAVISEIHNQIAVEHTVPVETLDEFCAEKNIMKIDLLKIDTEGNELSVLHGAKNLIKNGKIKCIHFEFNEMNVVSRSFFRDFRNSLQDYNLFRLLPSGMIPLNKTPLLTELFAYQNIIAIPKRINKRVEK